ncbi:hypothetical protein [Parabacteroides sp. PF5-9]|uniref:hypothetical protein n=1 Tax=Parabacteroides sp. PF5-9 TaxID=1742404 RepID=UPI00247563EC|nr:hypothetical protein [Parabacteroides sp. PF5-9]MDH6357627.1 hypothetical protein [Parabacteroides sp. PF5-9]
MKKNTEIQKISDDTNGDKIRSYIVGIMRDLQALRSNIDNLNNNAVIYEMYNFEISEADAEICALNNLMGNIIGYTVADDIWEKQQVSL